MDKLKTSDLGGFPFVLDDIRQFLGRLTSPANHGIYQAFNNLLRGFGDNFIVQGCVVSGTTGAFSITEGWVLLGGELVKVNAQGPFDEAIDNKFVKVTTFDSRGNKTFLNGSIEDTYEKNRAVVQDTVGNLAFNGARIEGILGLEEWVLEPFDAGDYVAGTGTWTVTSSFIRSIVRGKTMTVSLEVGISTLSGGPTTQLRIKTPQSKLIANIMGVLGSITIGGTTVPASFVSFSGSNNIIINPVDGSSIANGSIELSGTLTFEIQ